MLSSRLNLLKTVTILKQFVSSIEWERFVRCYIEDLILYRRERLQHFTKQVLERGFIRGSCRIFPKSRAAVVWRVTRQRSVWPWPLECDHSNWTARKLFGDTNNQHSSTEHIPESLLFHRYAYGWHDYILSIRRALWYFQCTKSMTKVFNN